MRSQGAGAALLYKYTNEPAKRFAEQASKRLRNQPTPREAGTGAYSLKDKGRPLRALPTLVPIRSRNLPRSRTPTPREGAVTVKHQSKGESSG